MEKKIKIIVEMLGFVFAIGCFGYAVWKLLGN